MDIIPDAQTWVRQMSERYTPVEKAIDFPSRDCVEPTICESLFLCWIEELPIRGKCISCKEVGVGFVSKRPTSKSQRRVYRVESFSADAFPKCVRGQKVWPIMCKDCFQRIATGQK